MFPTLILEIIANFISGNDYLEFACTDKHGEKAARWVFWREKEERKEMG